MKLSRFFLNKKFVFTRSRNVIPNIRLSVSRDNLINNLEIDLVLDIGANRGQWASELLSSGYKNNLISFEPSSVAFKSLKSRAALFKNWKVENVAIGSDESNLELNISDNSQLSSSFFNMEEVHLEAAPNSKFVTKELVRVKRLDSWLSKSSSLFLKIDTQGYEMKILQSISDQFWRQILVIEMEVSVIKTYDQPYLIEDIIAFLRVKGYKPYRLEPGLALKPFGQQLQMDIIFVKMDFIS